MSQEKIVLIFQRNGETFRHEWIIKRGLRGARDAKKILDLQRKWGDPIKIIGDGPIAKLLRKEYKIYNVNPQGYSGVSTKDILIAGAEVTGVPVKRIQKYSRKIRKRLRIK